MMYVIEAPDAYDECRYLVVKDLDPSDGGGVGVITRCASIEEGNEIIADALANQRALMREYHEQQRRLRATRRSN